MVFNATFHNMSSKKAIDLLYITNELYYIVFHRVHLSMTWIQTQNVSGEDIDRIRFCQSNCNAITITISPL
jgi:hypothetical protein